jgi:hypothetical protein
MVAVSLRVYWVAFIKRERFVSILRNLVRVAMVEQAGSDQFLLPLSLLWLRLVPGHLHLSETLVALLVVRLVSGLILVG